MPFTGFPPKGLDLMIENRLMDSREFYEEHKPEIKKLMIEPMQALCTQMAEEMLKIDPLFVTTPSRMISRVRRDTRYTHDKSLYRANMWMFYRRARTARQMIPFYYFEVGPESWGYGCYGCYERGEMETARQMILNRDRLFLRARDAISACGGILDGECYKRPKFPDAPEDLQNWLNRKNLGVSWEEREDYSPVFDGSFYPQMMERFHKLQPLYEFLCAVRERTASPRAEAVR